MSAVFDMKWFRYLYVIGFFSVVTIPGADEPVTGDAGGQSEEEVEYIVVLSEVTEWKGTIPSDKDLKIYFDVDKGVSYIFALYGEATIDIYSPFGLWVPSGITDPDIAAKVEEDLPTDAICYMFSSSGQLGEYYLILTKKERNKQAPFKIVEYTVYKFKKPVKQEPAGEAGPGESRSKSAPAN